MHCLGICLVWQVGSRQIEMVVTLHLPLTERWETGKQNILIFTESYFFLSLHLIFNPIPCHLTNQTVNLVINWKCQAGVLHEDSEKHISKLRVGLSVHLFIHTLVLIKTFPSRPLFPHYKSSTQGF